MSTMTRHSAEKAKSNGVRADFLENNLAMLAPSNGHGSHIFWSLPRCKKFVVSREPVSTLKIKSALFFMKPFVARQL